MKVLLFFFIILVSFACSQNSQTLLSKNSQENIQIINSNLSLPSDEIPKDWGRFEMEVLSFNAPKSLKKQKVQGIDSIVSQYKNADITLTIEYGGMSGNETKCPNPNDIAIDNIKAKICYLQLNSLSNEIIASFLNFNENEALHFELNFNNQSFREDAEKIIQSIKFK